MTPEQQKLFEQHMMGQFQAPPLPGGSSFDVNTQGPNLDDTVKMAGTGMQNVPAAPPEPIAPPPVPEAAEIAPETPDVMAPAKDSVAPHIDPRIVSSHPGLTQDELATYLQKQREQSDKFGPDQQKMVMDNIRKSQSGPVHTVARGGAAFADGIMQGVARAGNSNWLSSMDRRDQNETENALNEGKNLDESNMKHIASNQAMDQMDPHSSIGKAMLGTYGPLLDKLGVPKERQAQMLPALISTMAPELVKHEDTMARVNAERNRKDEMAAFRQENVDQQNWIKLGHDVNALNAGSRKALGVAASANMRADRLLRTAMNKDATNQDIHNMISDIQGIYKGGVPDEISLKHGQYKTLLGQLADIQTHLSSRPTAVRTPEVVQHLAKITRELKEIDNRVISDNLGINKVIYAPLIEKDPARWAELTGAVMGTTADPTEPEGGAAPAANEVTRKTKDGKIAVFDGATKQFLRYQ